jgi:hypothetical protein
MQGMKSLKEYMSYSQLEEEKVSEAKFISSPEEIDATNPVVKKLLKACDKYGYKLQKAFALINSKGKPSGHSTIVVTGYGPGYHPEIRKNLNSKPGAMYYIHFDLTLDAQLKDAKDYAEGVAKGVAMLEVMNSVDGDKLPGVL